ncbi:hypothetical protein H0H81_002965 [Sphagnurus paluster]|uniref:Glycoside hydrolase family 5 domain-containing protein n=1 Tax=Sphagnurus paluster TaxID=117069 RepID=A0A9P7GTQ2_9AGAR|nr:hypothetical protein H0H81_002965 [Sphagnurus paluster]
MRTRTHTLPLGLQYASLSDILDSFERLRINSVRLPFSNQMIRDATPIQDAWVAANPQLRGLTPLQVYDVIVKALTDRGFAVILNNHTNKSIWCCGANDGNDRWNKSQSDEAWAADWLFMVSRYRSNGRVVGADLYNEVDSAEIMLAMSTHLQLALEGINWTGIPVDGFAHHRPTLEPVRYLSHTFVIPNKLIYAAHFYGYTGPSHSGATGLGETSDLRYRDYSKSDLFQVINDQASYVVLDSGKHYTAPVWISEFGVESRGYVAESSRTWFNNMISYLTSNDMDFAIWPLIGYLGPSNTNGWALLNWNPTTGKRDGLYDGNDWRASAWDTVVGGPDGSTSPVPIPTRWQMLILDHGDFVKSLVQRARADWDSGARKGACPDGLRLIELSAGSTRALCTDSAGYRWASGNPTTTVSDERYVTTGDWASGYTKYQCPPNAYVIGYAIRGNKVSTLLCARQRLRWVLAAVGRAGSTEETTVLRGRRVGIFTMGNTKVFVRRTSILPELLLRLG